MTHNRAHALSGRVVWCISEFRKMDLRLIFDEVMV